MSVQRRTLGQMSGYAASARLHGGAPRFVAVGADAAGLADAQEVVDNPAAIRGRDGRAGEEWIELVGRPFDERLAAWWTDLREAWSQTTFFLFDPDSWR